MIYLLRNKKATSGFTLIELLVVIAIIGVLATVVLASLNTARRKSRDARRVTDLKQIQLALELYFDGFGANQYPTGLLAATPCVNDSGLTPLATQGYIGAVPHDPASATTCYRYASASINGRITYYHLAGILEDAANPVLNSDRDCNDAAAPLCLPAAPVPTWAGTLSNGDDTAACTGVSGAAGGRALQLHA